MSKDLAIKAKAKLGKGGAPASPVPSPKTGLSILDTLIFAGALIGLLAYIGSKNHDTSTGSAGK